MSWENNVKRVEPYIPGEQPKTKVIKLNTNENPYPPAPNIKVVLDEFDLGELRLYPDTNGGELRDCLAKANNLDSENVFVGVGSDEVLALAFLTFFNGRKPVLMPEITYSFYDVWANLFNIKYEKIPLGENFEININDYLKDNGGIIIANPNAPTGMDLTLDELEKLISHNKDSVVIIDEAYVDFGGQSVIPLIRKYDNLLVVQTFSKSRSMAGVRVGMAFGSRKLIAYLNDVKSSFNSYTMNRISAAAAVESLKDEEYFKSVIDKIIKTREKFISSMGELGFECLPSKANFVFCRHKAVKAIDILKICRENGIYLRHFNKPLIDNYLRITIGRDEEMEQLLSVLKQIVKEYDK